MSSTPARCPASPQSLADTSADTMTGKITCPVTSPCPPAVTPCLQNMHRLSDTFAHLGFRPKGVGLDRLVSEPVVVSLGGQGLTVQCHDVFPGVKRPAYLAHALSWP